MCLFRGLSIRPLHHLFTVSLVLAFLTLMFLLLAIFFFLKVTFASIVHRKCIIKNLSACPAPGAHRDSFTEIHARLFSSSVNPAQGHKMIQSGKEFLLHTTIPYFTCTNVHFFCSDARYSDRNLTLHLTHK